LKNTEHDLLVQDARSGSVLHSPHYPIGVAGQISDIEKKPAHQEKRWYYEKNGVVFFITDSPPAYPCYFAGYRENGIPISMKCAPRINFSDALMDVLDFLHKKESKK
jgi:hypothetical protein